MEKCAALSNLLQNKPDKLSFSVLNCGKIKIAGMDDLFTVDEVRRMLQERFKCSSSSVITTMEELEVNKYASIPVTQEMIPSIEKTAENTAVIVDMYEVDYAPVTEGASTQAIDKHFDAVNDFVSRMTFPDTTVSDIVVGPKEQIFKKKTQTPTRPDLPQNMNVPTRARASIWTKATQEMRRCKLEECGKEFVPESPYQLWCCLEHAHIDNSKPIKGVSELVDKCPECGSTEFGWMPADFETAKCSKCGKTWHGKNPPLPPTSKKATYGLQSPEDALYELWKQGRDAFPAGAEQLLRERYQFSAQIATEVVNSFLMGRNQQALTAPQREASWRKMATIVKV